MNITPQSHMIVLDMDETSAASGKPLKPEMYNLLAELQQSKGYILAFATARSYLELIHRMPIKILKQSHIFACFGMDVWHQDKNHHDKPFIWPEKINGLLNFLLQTCSYPLKTGDHIIERPFSGAFTPLGMNATEEERADFIKWESRKGYLQAAADLIKRYHPKLDVRVFGKTTVDFSDKIMSKKIILPKIRKITDRNVIFFGDNMQEGGNDKPLADVLKADSPLNINIPVSNPNETLEHLQKLNVESKL